MVVFVTRISRSGALNGTAMPARCTTASGRSSPRERARGDLVAQVGAAFVDARECGGGPVDAGDLVAGCRELGGDDAPESARRAGDDDVHCSLLFR